MSYKRAFKCKQYRGKNKRPCDCPAWTVLTETNISTGENRLNADCFFQSLPGLIIEGIKAANRPAAAMLEVRNTLHEGFMDVKKMRALAENAVPLIEEDNNDSDKAS